MSFYDIPRSTLLQKDSPERGDKLGVEICKVLGIDSTWVTEINLNMRAGGVASLTVTRFIVGEESTEIFKLLEKCAIDK